VELVLFGKASVVGLLIAAPVGPIGLLCIQHTLSSGARIGVAGGLGAATADAIYGAIGAAGLTAVIQLFTALSQPLAILGALFLAWMGFRLVQTPATKGSAAASNADGIFVAFGSTLLLTLANPMTILSFIAVFAALGGSQQLASTAMATMVAGVFFGSAFWWLILTGSITLVRHKLKESALTLISRGAGALLIGFAGWQIYATLS
jgi:threonine/homoserine/homoserine lactone efflux protein